jgi:CDP-diacylglycerol---glycerol-3-phosphate 3-phosphatidyltransferase
VAFLVFLIILIEIASIIEPSLGGCRRLDGPLGKVDRSIILSLLDLAVAAFGGLPESTLMLPPLLYGGLILTVWNRLRFAIADGGKASE